LAIRHAAGLDEANRNKGVEEKTALGLAQAQIYQIFDLLKGGLKSEVQHP
jgi:hypothetical protein